VNTVLIIGLGVVGTAQAYLSQKLGYKVFGYDINVKRHPYCKVVRRYVDSDIIFVCTPESVVEEVVKNLKSYEVGGTIAIKSTTPLGLTKNLSKKFDIHLCHNPEFLRENHSLEDVVNPSRVVVGECCRDHGRILEDFYKPLQRPIFITDPTTSELVKLVSNSFRALTITFWNEIALLAKETNIRVEEVAKLCNPAKLIGEWEGGNWGTKYFLKPYGGRCLPKDVNHLIQAFRNHNLNPKIFETCEELNNQLR